MQILKIRDNRKLLFLKIGMPVLLTVVLFVISSFFIIIPSIERNYMDNKRELIKELTQTAVSTFSHLHSQSENGEITKEEAKKRAIAHIRSLHYGEDNKDYFWVIDKKPEMIVHPYRPDLEGEDISGFLDRSGLPIFVKFVDIVQKNNFGYLTYTWQFKDQAENIVPKLSYVQLFEPWGWIVGTGVYIEDVKAHIVTLKQRLTHISVAITVVICILLFYVTRQSLRIEQQRRDYANDLAAAKEKYKALVQATDEGIILAVKGEALFTNKAFQKISGYTSAESAALSVNELFSSDTESMMLFKDGFLTQGVSGGPLETKLKHRDGRELDVVVGISHVDLNKKTGYIISVKNISIVPEIVGEKKAKKEQEILLAELQTALLYLNQPVKGLAEAVPKYDITISIQALSRLMSKHHHSCALICNDKKTPVGIVTDSDIRRRVVSEGISPSAPASKIMTSPLLPIHEDAMIYEVIAQMKENYIRHVLVKDKGGDIDRYISAKKLILNHQYSLSFLSQEIKTAATPDEMFDLRNRIPQLITTLVNCGAYPQNITKIITTISEAILNRFINFAIEELGPPPAKFAFIVMGSVGRQEQTLKTDQDNAIIFEDTVDAKFQDEIQAYFLEFGTRICGWLDRIGYDFCKGLVMAKNPRWCVSLSAWKKYFRDWIENGTPQDLLDTKIFFDFRFAYGEKSLCDELRDHLDKQLEGKTAFMAHLVQNCLLFKPPIGMFKKLIVEPVGEHKEKISLKKCMTPIVDLARIYCLKNRIHATNTSERLEALARAGIFNPGDYEEILQSYSLLMQIRFRHQSDAISMNSPPDNYITPKTLTRNDQVILKEVLSSVAGFQARLSTDFKTSA